MATDGDPVVVYLGHTLMSRKEYEKMNNDVNTNNGSAINCTYIGDPMPGYDNLDYWMQFQQYQPLYPSLYSQGVILSGNQTTPQFRERRIGDQLHLNIDLPGVEQKDLVLTIEGNTLKVQYSRIDEGANKWVTHYVDPREFDVRNVKASFRACILSVTLNAIPKPKPEKIEIEIGG